MTPPAYFHLADAGSQQLLGSSAKDAPYHVESRFCFHDGTHLHNRRTTDLALEVKHNKRDELIISSWTGERVVHRSLTGEFESRGFTGYRLRPATVRFRDGYLSDEYSELIVTGWAGIARPESGIELREDCPGCPLKRYTSLQDAEQLIDWSQWTGEDFFIVWPLPLYTLVTNRVADALKSLKVKSYRLSSLRMLEQRFIPASLLPSHGGFTVGALSDFMPDDIAIKYGKPAGLEWADA
jgi:hypothetical protein